MIKFFRRLITLWRSRHVRRAICLSPLNEDQKSRFLKRVESDYKGTHYQIEQLPIERKLD